jgi:hypothetical protein
MRFITILTAALAMSASDALAQPASEPRWDLSVLAGFFAGHAPEPPDSAYFDHWINTGELGFAAARYLNRHLKIEGEARFTGEGRRYQTGFTRVPGVPNPMPVSIQQYISTRAVSAAATWQFLENQWVHPYLLAGAAFESERQRFDTFQQSPRRGDPFTVQYLRGIVGGGAKVYLTPRGFFRADTRVGVGGEGSHVVFRAGFGVDF